MYWYCTVILGGGPLCKYLSRIYSLQFEVCSLWLGQSSVKPCMCAVSGEVDSVPQWSSGLQAQLVCEWPRFDSHCHLGLPLVEMLRMSP